MAMVDAAIINRDFFKLSPVQNRAEQRFSQTSGVPIAVDMRHPEASILLLRRSRDQRAQAKST
jgi:hypothetical protein